jgi:hypothetical protein
MSTQEITKYYIHDNGGRPFEVTIYDNTNKVNIAKKKDDIYINFLTYYPKKIFIGKSPSIAMTQFSGGDGPRFDGNSILLHIKNNEYIWIGSEIYSFTSLNKIIKYVSPVGNSDVPYPYAVDKDNNYYLMIENVIIINSISEINHYEEPYEYYYHEYNIIDKNFNNICKYYIGSNTYNLIYCPNAEENYDRIMSWDEGKMFIQKNGDDKKYELNKKDYINLINEYGSYINFKKLNHTIIQQRL